MAVEEQIPLGMIEYVVGGVCALYHFPLKSVTVVLDA